jgi:hypothetical protein
MAGCGTLEPSLLGAALHLATIPIWFNVAFVGGTALITLWRGGPDVRVMGALQLFLILNSYTHLDGAISFGASPRGVYPSHDHPVPIDLVDVVEFAVCLALALRSRSYWTIWASSILLLTMLTDVLQLTLPTIGNWAYASVGLVWTYALSTILLWGALARRPPASASGLPAPT